jgi:hypothetical protein
MYFGHAPLHPAEVQAYLNDKISEQEAGWEMVGEKGSKS